VGSLSSIDGVLVTGGAGFIGSFTVDLLVERGYDVIILDILEPQVHQGKAPEYLNEKAKFIKGDVRDKELLTRLAKEVDAVIHLAAAVGVGQSMYQIEKYIEYNTRGTATLLDILVNKENDVKKLIVASSMSIYGEGKYYCEKCEANRYPELRGEEQLANKIWDPLCPECKTPLKPLPTDEDKPLMPTSIYALSKRHQEEICLLTGKTYGIPTVALRYFNAYGPRQSLTNPYTGVCAIFTSRILSNNPPYIFEDGKQTRDFIHVKDVAKANLQALEFNSADYMTVNVGTGKPLSIRKLAEILIELYGIKLQPYISSKYRKGDIRHCYADTQRMHKLLNFKPTTNLRDGLTELTEWAKTHRWEAADLFNRALDELRSRKLTT